MEFIKFKKIPRLSRDVVITEKLDGSNAQIFIISYKSLVNNSEITDNYIDHITSGAIAKFENKEDKFNPYFMFAGSRNRWLSVDNGKNCDNHGFASWVKENAEELLNLGEGRHFGEWFGKGIQRNYGLDEKRFALFNTHKWHKFGEEPRLISINPQTKEEKYTIPAPKCCEVVPILFEGMFNTITVDTVLLKLRGNGSYAVPGFDDPEGIVIFHQASGQLFKKTAENDEKPKSV